MKKSISMGIYAIMFMFITSAVLSSCNSEDEYYENSNYTLASKRMTRSKAEEQAILVQVLCIRKVIRK